MSRTLLATASAVGAMLLASAAPAVAQSPATQTLTFREVDQGSTFAFVDNPPRAPHRHGAPTRVSAGDLFVVSNRLVDAAGKPFGRLRAMCFVSEPGTPQDLHGDCFGVFSLPSGQLWASGTTGPGLTTGAILGGTGAYVSMHGTFVSKSTKTGADDTVSLVA
jgi:hypothetical protein